MKVVGYVRVSTEGQVGEDKFGIPEQEKGIREYCEKNGHELLKIYVDAGKSGACEDRPELNKIVYGEMSNPPIEAVVVNTSDRVARDINLYFHYKYELLRKEIKLISVKEDFGVAGVFSQVLESFIVSMAQVERERIKQRLGDGRVIKHQRGGYSGGNVPYGYMLEDGGYIINEEEAEVVREIFEMYWSGVGLREISRRLADRGVISRSGAPIGYSVVHSVIGNEKTYRGLIRYGNQKDAEGKFVLDEKGRKVPMENWVRGVHEPILKGDSND